MSLVSFLCVLFLVKLLITHNQLSLDFNLIELKVATKRGLKVKKKMTINTCVTNEMYPILDDVLLTRLLIILLGL